MYKNCKIDYENKSKLLFSLLNFINKVKEHDAKVSIMDIILEFVEINDIEMNYVSEAIKSDKYFKQLLYKDCVNQKIIQETD